MKGAHDVQDSPDLDDPTLGMGPVERYGRRGGRAWATPLRFVLFRTGAVCVLLYLIVRWLIWRERPDRAEAR